MTEERLNFEILTGECTIEGYWYKGVAACYKRKSTNPKKSFDIIVTAPTIDDLRKAWNTLFDIPLNENEIGQVAMGSQGKFKTVSQREEIRYVAAYKDKEGNYGCYDGPTPDLDGLLQDEPIEIIPAFIIAHYPNRKEKELYRWHRGKKEWIKLSRRTK